MKKSRTGCPANVRITSRMRGKETSPRYRLTDQNSLETREAVLAPLRAS